MVQLNMTAVPADELNTLLDRVSHKLTIAEFRREISCFWRRELRQRKYLDQIRFSRGACKKFMDEIVPVAQFIAWKKIKSKFIQFPLDNKVPDCFLWENGGKASQGIEVTIAQGRARFYLMQEAVGHGTGRGFLELQDDDSVEEFDRAFEREPDGYTTDQALHSVKSAIRLCLKNKNHPKYASMDLLIQGPINVATLPRERWRAIRSDLVNAAECMPFREIYVIGDGSRNPICLRIK